MSDKKQSTITVNPMPVPKNGRATISYNGHLSNLGSNKLYLHYGYGTNNEWNNVGQKEMTPSPKGYTTTVTINEAARLNLCIHDNQGHWDNNMGNNWSYEIE